MSQDPGPFRDGQVHVLSEKCATCIFRPGNLMRLVPGRVKQMVETSIADDSAITCHSTLPSVAKEEGQEAICRGYWDSYGEQVLPIRLAQAMDMVTEVEPPPKRD